MTDQENENLPAVTNSDLTNTAVDRDSPREFEDADYIELEASDWDDVNPFEEYTMDDSRLTTIWGDLTNAFIDELKVAKKPWQQLSENQQGQVIDRCKGKAAHCIKAITAIVANRGFDHCAAAVDTVTVKDGTKIVLKAMDRSAAIKFVENEGEVVTVVFADTEGFLGSENMPAADPDQRTIDGIE